MPQPYQSQVHVNRPLTNVAVAYAQSADNFIADKVFPVVPTDKKSDIYVTYTKHDWMRDDAKERAPGTEAAMSGFNVDTSNTFNCRRYDLAHKIPDDIRDNADEPMNDDMAVTEWLTQQLMIRRERIWAANYFVTGVWGTTNTLTGNDQWSSALSDPVSQMHTAHETVALTGRSANAIVAGYQVFNALKRHPVVKENFKYTSAESITAEMLARFFEVEKFYVAKGVYSASIEGDTTPTYSFIQGKHLLLCYVEPTPSKFKPSAGYTFAWKKFGGNNSAIRVKKWRDEKVESDIVESAFCVDQKIVCTDCGYFFLNAIA